MLTMLFEKDSIRIDKSAINLHGGNVKKLSDDIGFSLQEEILRA